MKKLLLSFLLFFALHAFAQAQAPKREFRGAWIATYANIDWPSKTQTPAQQRAALISILDHHKATGINAIFLQVRSQSDALYASTLEPWSADLTGTQGKAPSPFWDPLQFALDECHKRGMELHAWINPYRAMANYNQLSTFALNHVARQHPEWLITSGSLRTLDPGLPQVRNYIMTVIADIVQRYDLDGIHFDDYFYPSAAFNDDATYNTYSRGFTDRGDWRRDNVNLLIQRVHDTIDVLKPWVKFGVSPSGIYRNSTNPDIGSNTSGLQHYVTLYADSKKWLQEGWVDYLAPQVYWYIGQPGANYGVVVPWWNNNSFGRHIYIGLAGYKVNDPAQGTYWANPSQIPNQVRLNRSLANIYGQAVYNTSSLRSATKLGFRDSLRTNLYQKPALLPSMPWRDATPPAVPSTLVANRHSADSVLLTWDASPTGLSPFDQVVRYVVYRSESSALDITNTSQLLAITPTAGNTFRDRVPDASKTYYYTITAVDRFHNESAPSNVTDYTAPVIACLESQTLSLATECTAALPDYRSLVTVTDDVSSGSALTLTQSPAAGTLVSEVGAFTVTLTATDASGKSASCSFAVEKQDTTPPVLLAQNLTRSLQNGTVTVLASEVNNGSYDNCTLDISSLTLSKSTFTCANIGQNIVTLTGKDASGNEASVTATVTIVGLLPAPAIAISRQDQTYTGLPDNTIALGYGAQQVTLTASNPSSAPGQTTYAWSPAAVLSTTTSGTTVFTPTTAGSYTFTVQATNEYGCSQSAQITLQVIDVRCGNKGDKVLVCHATGSARNPSNPLCIAPSAVPAHLKNGGSLGNCTTDVLASTRTSSALNLNGPVLAAYPNPFADQLTVNFTLETAEEKVTLEIYDLYGKKVTQVYSGAAEAFKTYSFEVNASALAGRFFYVRLITPGKIHTFKLSRQ
ncbi:family 10 glycosylhydrolase [Rufibacter radiotolerans]|uniref:family 10 glycosylhydrolase n=1 Tax=Rufibacter radiotolerans TaxID=1379910 RepID=UPI0006647B25|nr:family 10 glycosylhydrolase [Rufibacter radiotolerans]